MMNENDIELLINVENIFILNKKISFCYYY